MSARRFLIGLSLGIAALAASLAAQHAQTPAQAQPPAAPATPAPVPSAQAPAPPGNYIYAPEGRRDPFVSLINRGTEGRSGGRAVVPLGEGLAALTTDELVVRGIVQSRGAWSAMVAGAAGKVFTARPGDKLADGTIRSITAQYVVIQQQVNDPLSIEKQREVRKPLRGGENK
jgi:Tfp pilus assembly protein PilP